MNNRKIRNALKSNGLYLYNLGEILNVSEATITRMMRHELSQDEQARIITLIEREGKKK